MNKKNNKFIKLFAIPVVASLAFTGCEGSKSAEEHVAAAQMLIENDKTSAAIIELKNAIKSAPENALARYTLGKIYLEQGNVLSAIKELSRAAKGGEVLNNSVLPLLARAYQLNGDESELLALANTSGNLTDISKLQIAVYTSIYYSQKNEQVQAKNYLDIAINISEENVYSQLANAWLKSSQKQHDDAVTIVNNIVATSPDLSEAVLLQGHLFSAKGQHAEAAKSYQSYSAKHPLQYQVKMFAANSLVAAGENEQATVALDELLKYFPKHPFVNQLKAQLAYGDANYESTKEYANTALQSSELPMAKLLLGLSAFQLKEYELAYQSLRTVVGQLSGKHPVHKLYASLQLQLGYQNDAVSSFEQLDDLTEQDTDFLQSASMSFARSGNDELAAELIDKALALTPNDANLVLQKGMLQLKSRDDTGYKFIEQALALNPELKTANITLAAKYISQKEFKKALQLASDWKQTVTGKIPALLLEGTIYSEQKDFSKAKGSFLTVIEQEPENTAANYYLGLLALNDKDIKQASTYFKTTIQSNPEHSGAISKLILIGTKASESKDVDDFLSAIQKQNPDKMIPILAKAANYHRSGKIKEGIDFLIEFENKSIVNEQYWFTLANLYQTDKQYDQATLIYKKLLGENNKNNNARLALISTLATSHNYDAVVKEAKKGEALEPENKQYQIIIAKYLLKQEKVGDAKAVIAKLMLDIPESINVKRLSGELALIDNDLDKAELIFRDIYHETGKASNLVELVTVLKKNGRQDNAIKQMETYLVKSPDSTKIKALLAEFQIIKSPEKALAHYYVLLEKSPKNIVLLNNIAWGELQLGALDKAAESANQAYQLAGDNYQVIDTYAQVLLAQGSVPAAISLFEKAKNMANGDQEITLHLAEALVINKDFNSAKALINELTALEDELLIRLEKLKNQLL